MLNLVRSLAGLLSPTRVSVDPVESDPFDHPALRAMSARELADLPFDRGARMPTPETACGPAAARRYPPQTRNHA